MELELVSLKPDGKVALGDPVPASLKGHLVPSQPALVAHHSSTVDGCTIDVIVNVAAEVDVVALVARLDLAALLPGRMMRRNRVFMSKARNITVLWQWSYSLRQCDRNV